MVIRFSRSAARHGIRQDRSHYVVEHCTWPLYSADPEREDLVLFLGPDARGVPLEVAGLELADGGLLVIHATRLRKTHGGDYARVMQCQGR